MPSLAETPGDDAASQERWPGADAAKPWNEASYRAVANALPEIIWTCDAEGRLEWLNDRWRELTGQTAEQSRTSEGTLDAVHPDDHAEIRQRFGKALAAGTPCELEYRIRTKAGSYRWHLARVLPLRSANGAVARWLAAAFDIDDRRRTDEALRASERRFETLFNLNPQPIAVTRISDGTYLHVNAALLWQSGFSREELLGKSTVEVGMQSGQSPSTATNENPFSAISRLESSARAV